MRKIYIKLKSQFYMVIIENVTDYDIEERFLFVRKTVDGHHVHFRYALDDVLFFSTEDMEEDCDNDCEHCEWVECPKD